ncbi:MAG: hypothetical protein IT349_05590, partial [Candidatus Eisenbacteria bacterium]|nr:hypothetical protein [Candidatus Eisenbacteria bacterium]
MELRTPAATAARSRIVSFYGVLVLGLAAWAAPVQAGPNAGGTLIVHAQPEFDATNIGNCESTCDCLSLTNCDQALASVGTDRPYYFFVVAAFPPSAAPRVAGITFGLQYPGDLSILSAAKCAQFELADAGWPASGTGTALSFSSAQTDLLVPIYLFSAQSYYGGSLELIPHPLQGGSFADDSVPSQLDPIADFGALGFGQPGVTPCPATGPLVGACCYLEGFAYICDVREPASCAEIGGDFRGLDTTCDPWPCEEQVHPCCLRVAGCIEIGISACIEAGGYPVLGGVYCSWVECGTEVPGACCLPDESCVIVRSPECFDAGGSWIGPFRSCDPEPCTSEGACCLDDGSCVQMTELNCRVNSGLWSGTFVPCDPDPCPTVGACCTAVGNCRVLTPEECTAQGGEYLGDDQPCTPDPCTGAPGACCLDDGVCVIRFQAECTGEFKTFLGEGSSCDPNPCPVRIGACCLRYLGTCTQTNPSDCIEANVLYLGDGVPCEPNPCPQP